MTIIFAREFHVRCNLCKLDVKWEVIDAHQIHVLQFRPTTVCNCGGTITIEDLGDINENQEERIKGID